VPTAGRFSEPAIACSGPVQLAPEAWEQPLIAQRCCAVFAVLLILPFNAVALRLRSASVVAVDLQKVLLSAKSRSHRGAMTRCTEAPPGEGAVSFGYLSWGKQRKVTPAAGSRRPQAQQQKLNSINLKSAKNDS